MHFLISKTLVTTALLFAAGISGFSQSSIREFRFDRTHTLEVIHHSGRVAVLAAPQSEDPSGIGVVSLGFDAGISESDINVTHSNDKTVIRVSPSDREKRIDLTLRVPERIKLKAETGAGVIETSGNFMSIEANTVTGSIVTDTPTADLTYLLSWTQSRPRYLADFPVGDVKERARGRFEIQGHLTEEREGAKVNSDAPATENKETGNAKPEAVSLKLTTARGIILLNVPPNEVVSDLRQRPLTEAAKAIVKSGDSLLTEAIRRASPKYFGDYLRTLPPLITEPKFAAKQGRLAIPVAPVKTAFVRVTDLKNRSIPGLGKKDFEVVENGSEREVVSVSQSTAPFNLVLLLDVSGSIENYVNFIRKAARSFVQTVGRDDRVSIIIFNDDVKVLSTFTTDRSKLSESLDTFDAGGGTAYYDALAYAISDTLRPLRGERTAIVVLTDGDDNRSFLAFDSLAGSIQESGSLIYPLYVPSGLIAHAALNSSDDIDPMRKKYMSLTAKSEGEGEKLAKLSGGVYYPITEIRQIQEAYEDIVVQMRSAYMVTFRSDNSASNGGALAKLRIKARPANTFTTVTSVVASGE